MADDTLDNIAESIGTITEEQYDGTGDGVAREGDEEFDPEEFRVDAEEYDGGWDTSH
jgi:hypothetical protein